MMVVMLGDEETEIDDGHRLLQARMQRRAHQFRWAHASEPVDDSAADRSKFGENFRDRPIVMSGLVRFSILKVRRMEFLRPGVVIIESLIP